MAGFNQDKFNDLVINYCLGFSDKPRILASGKPSYWYCSWDKVLTDPFLLEKVILNIFNFVQDQNLVPDTYYGVPDGATPLGLITQFTWATSSRHYGIGSHVLSVGRKETKSHGDEDDKNFVGTPRAKTIILEDVTTTGDSLIKNGLDRVQNYAKKAELLAAISLTTRMSIAMRGDFNKKVQERYNANFYFMSDALLLLPEAYQRQKPGEYIGALVEEELARNGISIKLR